MKRSLRNQFRKRAGYLAWCLCGGGDWRNFNPWRNNNLAEENAGPSKVIFKLPGGRSYIVISDLRPNKITKATIHKPILIGKKEIDNFTALDINKSEYSTMTQEYTYTDTSGDVVTTEIGGSLELKFQQSIGYGGMFLRGETSLSIAAKIEFNRIYSGSELITKSAKSTVVIPPMTESSFSTSKSIANFSQDVEYDCELDYSVYFFSKDVGEFTIRSLRDLELVSIGDGYSDLFPRHRTTSKNFVDNSMKHLQKHKIVLDQHVLPPTKVSLREVVEIENSTISSTNLKQKKID